MSVPLFVSILSLCCVFKFSSVVISSSLPPRLCPVCSVMSSVLVFSLGGFSCHFLFYFLSYKAVQVLLSLSVKSFWDYTVSRQYSAATGGYTVAQRAQTDCNLRKHQE